MKWIAEIRVPKHIRCVIEKQRLHDITNNIYLDGYYLYVYEGNKEPCIRDYLQDTLEVAKEQALEEFNIPLNAWVQIE